MKKCRMSVEICLVLFVIVGCEGMKVVHPEDENQNKGTLALDTSGGNLKLVGTYTCKLDSMGKKFSVVDKTEDAARKEVVARCRDATVVSICEDNKVKCVKN